MKLREIYIIAVFLSVLSGHFFRFHLSLAEKDDRLKRTQYIYRSDKYHNNMFKQHLTTEIIYFRIILIPISSIDIIHKTWI